MEYPCIVIIYYNLLILQSFNNVRYNKTILINKEDIAKEAAGNLKSVAFGQKEAHSKYFFKYYFNFNNNIKY